MPGTTDPGAEPDDALARGQLHAEIVRLRRELGLAEAELARLQGDPEPPRGASWASGLRVILVALNFAIFVLAVLAVVAAATGIASLFPHGNP